VAGWVAGAGFGSDQGCPGSGPATLGGGLGCERDWHRVHAGRVGWRLPESGPFASERWRLGHHLTEGNGSQSGNHHRTGPVRAADVVVNALEAAILSGPAPEVAIACVPRPEVAVLSVFGPQIRTRMPPRRKNRTRLPPRGENRTKLPPRAGREGVGPQTAPQTGPELPSREACRTPAPPRPPRSRPRAVRGR
jgi:hypothetical protein